MEEEIRALKAENRELDAELAADALMGDEMMVEEDELPLEEIELSMDELLQVVTVGFSLLLQGIAVDVMVSASHNAPAAGGEVGQGEEGGGGEKAGGKQPISDGETTGRGRGCAGKCLSSSSGGG